MLTGYIKLLKDILINKNKVCIYMVIYDSSIANKKSIVFNEIFSGIKMNECL